MRVLLVSSLVYLAGIAFVLYFRPALMFHKDGRWKEFSVLEADGTVFPFWGFCLVWAFASFLMTWIVLSDGDVVTSATLPQTLSATASLASASNSLARQFQNTAFMEEAEESRPRPSRKRAEEDLVQPLSVPAVEQQKRASTLAPQPFGRPGYYRLDEVASQRNGVPRYIYVGPELPSESEEGMT